MKPLRGFRCDWICFSIDRYALPDKKATAWRVPEGNKEGRIGFKPYLTDAPPPSHSPAWRNKHIKSNYNAPSGL
jgi:hypothetical protein